MAERGTDICVTAISVHAVEKRLNPWYSVRRFEEITTVFTYVTVSEETPIVVAVTLMIAACALLSSVGVVTPTIEKFEANDTTGETKFVGLGVG